MSEVPLLRSNARRKSGAVAGRRRRSRSCLVRASVQKFVKGTSYMLINSKFAIGFPDITRDAQAGWAHPAGRARAGGAGLATVREACRQDGSNPTRQTLKP